MSSPFLQELKKRIGRAGMRIKRDPLREMEKVNARIEGAMLGKEGKMSKAKIREVIRGVAGDEAAKTATISPRVTNRYSPISDLIQRKTGGDVKEDLKDAPKIIQQGYRHLVGNPIHTQPIAGVAAHEATHYKQGQMAHDVGAKVGAAIHDKLPAGVQDTREEYADKMGNAARTAMAIGYGLPNHPAMAAGVAKLQKGGHNVTAAATTAVAHAPRLAMEGHANVAALKQPGGRRVAAVSQGSYTIDALQRIKKAFTGQELSALLDHMIEFKVKGIKPSEAVKNIRASMRKHMHPTTSRIIQGAKKKTIQGGVPGDAGGASMLSANLTQLVEFAGGYINTTNGVKKERGIGAHLNRNAGKYIGATVFSPALPISLPVGWLIDKKRRNHNVLRTRSEPNADPRLAKNMGLLAKLDKLIEFGKDPRPRNSLGMFADQQEGVADPNSMVKTYRGSPPSPSHTMEAAAVGGGVGGVASGTIRALLDAIRRRRG